MSTLTKENTRASWEALGTSVELVVSDGSALEQARAIVELQLHAIDLACSRFRDDSELTRVNTNAGRHMRASSLLIEAVEVALRAAQLTSGDVDPTLGRALELSGYDRDWRLLDRLPPAWPSDASCNQPPLTGDPGMSKRPPTARRAHAPCVLATVRAGWEAVEVNRERSTLRIPRGMKLDLGATAKAWAADRAGRAVYEATGSGVLVSLGGDISTAGPSPAGGWRVHVTDDHRNGPHAPGQTVTIAGGGLATSSTSVRRWRHDDGRAMHHIIDPSTSEPVVSAWRTVSVAAKDCTDANIAATAAIVRGESAPGWLADLQLPARLVACEGEVVRVGRWPEQGERQMGRPASTFLCEEFAEGTVSGGVVGRAAA
jgi:FAD:protein FMN transferase